MIEDCAMTAVSAPAPKSFPATIVLIAGDGVGQEVIPVAAVVARSFARIYFRNGINQGLLLITCPAVVDAAQTGDAIEIDLAQSTIRLNGAAHAFPPLSPNMRSIIAAGGLVAHVRHKLGLSSTTAVKFFE